MAKATQEKAKRKVSKIYYILIDRKRPVRKRETFLFARIHPFENLKRWVAWKAVTGQILILSLTHFTITCNRDITMRDTLGRRA